MNMISLVFYTKNKNKTMNCKPYMCHIILLGKSEQNSVPGNIFNFKVFKKDRANDLSFKSERVCYVSIQNTKKKIMD